MYHALAIGLSSSLLTNLQALVLQDHLQFTEAITLQVVGRLLSEIVFHLLIIDLEYLRSIQQVHWLSNLRYSSFAPVIVLSNNPEQDLTSIIDLGADICISRKCSPHELAELAHAQLRRYTEYNHYDDPCYGQISVFQQGDIFIDPARRMVKVQGIPVNLRPREFSLLLYFMRNPNIVLTSEQICAQAWGMEGSYGHGVAQPVHILRQAIEPNPENPTYIHTVRRVGYRFTPNYVKTCEIC